MPNNYWKQFKSGSDIRGTALGDEDKINLTNKVIRDISLAFATWIANKTWTEFKAMSIAVGNDPRLSSMRIKTSVINSLSSAGIKIYDCSLASTPSMFMSVQNLSCTASLEITASHHPADKNGIKFFTKEGSLSSDNIDEILDIAEKGDFPPVAPELGCIKPINIMGYYCEKIKNVITKNLNFSSNEEENSETPQKPLNGLKIVVNAGNGVGGFFVKNILDPLGADTSSSIFLNPDGNFPNHTPNPESDEAINALSTAVLDSKSDLGIIFDTDVDRVGFVDSKGKPINRSRFIALACAIVLEENPGTSIVTDSVTSDKLTEFIEKLGGIHFRYKRGYRNVIDYAKEINESGIDCALAIESSGHVALKENKFSDDGAYLAAKIIAKYSQLKSKGLNIDDLLKEYTDAKGHIEIRIPIHSTKVISSGRQVLTQLKKYILNIKSCSIEKKNQEGVRLTFKARWQEGWCIIRQSVHDPILVLNIESYVNNGSMYILKSLIPFFEKFDFINMDEINKQIEKIKTLEVL